jgi:Zn-dependent M16 (insulinase) family peptidase
MKGVFSSPDNVYYTEAQTRLYPGTTYENVSGGAPSAITDLTWEQLRDFHAR